MAGVLLFVLVAALCVTGAWWLAALPGSVSATVAGTTFETSAPVAIVAVAVLFLVLYAVVRLVAGLFSIPRGVGRRNRESRRRRGDEAVTRTLIALAGSDSAAARRAAGRSRKLLGDTPLTLLLAAHAGRQAGQEDEAQAIFRRLADRSDGRLLGLRGLMRQAMAREDWTAASAIARQADEANPGAGWFAEERKYVALRTGQWGEALRLSTPKRGVRGGVEDAGARAALALAAAREETNEGDSLRLASQAWEAQPSLAPAAVAYAEGLRRAGKERSALDVLRRSWALQPHPDVSAAYLAPVSDRMGRLRAAQQLAAGNPAHPDTALLLARTALEAGLTGEARRYAETARKAGLTDRRLSVLLSDIAETDGDANGAQEALRQLPGASAAPGWRCLACGTAHQAWHPVCEACSTTGRIAWVAGEKPRAVVAMVPRRADIDGFL